MSGLVNLFALGVQKCGTTTLAAMLGSHKEIFVPSIKETYFFCVDHQFKRGARWYEDEFYAPQRARAARYRVDATPFHLHSRSALERIAQYAPAEARFIVILREPVSRAVSAYQHQIGLGYETLPFEAALDAEAERIRVARAGGERWWRHAYVEIGRYADALSRTFDLLGAERVLVLRQDELREPEATRRKIEAFLDLGSPFPLAEPLHRNKSSVPRSQILMRLVARDNILKSAAQAIVPREIRSRIGDTLLRLNASRAPALKVSDETRARLRAAFADDQAALAAMGIASHNREGAA